ncbi:hypothetical protein FOL47_008710 [Perkinsus chesapeaki]|uniref:Uncharacterized protein n=1 Tax=Perkinsus chesapeaki TaxID=330153 RepID=A0A7J6LC89_PERCH|nr:hypothetical protein FOL47_008710 [Perkinsus chesapeaki]
MNEMELIASHVMIDTDNATDLEMMIEALKPQYKGREFISFYWTRRIEQYVRGYHPIRSSFFSALRQCVFTISRGDEELALSAIRSTGVPTDIEESDSDTESIWFGTEGTDELDIGETLGAEAEADVEPTQPSSSSQQDASRISDLRRQSIKFRESIFKTQSPLSNTRSATLFRQLDAKYQFLDAADRAVRIWAEFELQRNVDATATSSRAGA